MDDAAPEDKPQLSVCVIAYNSGPLLRRCLESLAAQTLRGFEILVIDNASPDPADAEIAAGFAGVRLVRNSENLGFAGAGNQGARLARGRWYVLLNPDAWAEPDWLEQLLAAARRHPQVRSFTSRQLMAEDPGMLDGLGDVMSGYGIPYRGGYLAPDPGDTPEAEVFSPCGAAMMIDRALFLAMGGFDEQFFCYCEDVDLGYRLQLAGEPTVVVPSAVVRHEGSATSGGRKSEFAVFHGTRNRFWVVFKDTPLLLIPLVLPLHLAAVAYISSRRDNRAQAGVVWRAFVAALKGLPQVMRSRRSVQKARRVSALQLARAMTWDPKDLVYRRPVIRPLRPTRSGGA
ncbi:glycosyltransferase family 2 protein [Phenylobacterium sp.]|jgi:GT2 family glycosyltransferase|uniref:glycosyltransferase family 2 protein n=1 Tax=Phenylobacterium sp. TaxID=1871053 RepID=UPI002F921BE1